MKIFSLLPYASLSKLKQTCKKWNNLIGETIQKRKAKVETLLFSSEHTSENCAQNDLINSENFNQSLTAQVDALKLSGEFSLVFVNEMFSVHLNELPYENKSKRKRVEAAEIVLNHLKELIRVPNGLISSAYAVVGTDLANSSTIEIEDDSCDALVSIMFPKSNFYKIVMTQNLKELTTQTKSSIVNHIFLISKSWKSFKMSDLKAFKCPVSGGQVNYSYKLSAQVEAQNSNFIALVSENSDDVRIAQIVLPSCEKDEFDQIATEKLTRLQKTGIANDTKNRCVFAYQVTCCGKGKEYHNESNYESIMFKKYFPNVRLVGFYANGEMGLDFLPDYTKEEPDLTPNLSELKLLGFTTVFTIVSVKI